jgi:hypothetical protein
VFLLFKLKTLLLVYLITHFIAISAKPYVDEVTAVAQWLRYCAANRKVAGSIPDGVIGIFH